MIPGEIFVKSGEIVCNEGRETLSLAVINTGDRPIQVGSHFHFFEVNKALAFDRTATIGMRLNIAAGTAVRFEAGEEKNVELVTVGGQQVLRGFNALCDGDSQDAATKKQAIELATQQHFKTTS